MTTITVDKELAQKILSVLEDAEKFFLGDSKHYVQFNSSVSFDNWHHISEQLRQAINQQLPDIW